MKVVGVTSCSTGIAHTYMAAEALKKAAKSLGYEVKVETQGSVGTEDKLTEDDIKNANIIIIASDVPISGRDRFEGLDNVYESGSEPFIINADQELKKAIDYLKK